MLLQQVGDKGILDKNGDEIVYDVDFNHYIKKNNEKEAQYRKRRLQHLEQYNAKVKEIHEEEERQLRLPKHLRKNYQGSNGEAKSPTFIKTA